MNWIKNLKKSFVDKVKQTFKRERPSRKDQDDFAIESYQRAAKAWTDGNFNEEIVHVSVPQRRGEDIIVSEDEEYKLSLIHI